MGSNTQSISEKNPWVSNSMGCNPKDREKHMEDLRKHGVKNVEINEKGQLIAYSQKGRNEALKAYGMIDRDGGYGQYTGR